jgi:hypothetical protein
MGYDLNFAPVRGFHVSGSAEQNSGMKILFIPPALKASQLLIHFHEQAPWYQHIGRFILRSGVRIRKKIDGTR